MDYKILKDNFCFQHVYNDGEEKDKEIYFCTCGKKITQKNNKAKKDELTLEVETNSYYGDLDVFDRIEGTVNVICPKCKTDYSKKANSQKIKEANIFFYGYFDFVKEDKKIFLYKNKVKTVCTEKSRFVKFKEEKSYLLVDEENKKLFYKSFNSKKEKEFNLDEIIKVLKDFYLSDDGSEITIIDKIVSVHMFLSEVARIVVDSKNINIIDGLMSQMIGKAGLDILMKINSIFFGIICYSNLSTIALTKGSVFLYDMMSNCNLPNPSVLSDNGVTSPLKIFNFLVTIENKKTQEELDLEKNTKSDFVYKSKDGKKFINFNAELERWGFNNINNGTKLDFSYGKINVREDLKNKTVSKYIFNKIEKFNEYKKLIRFTKFISYEELINLVMKYDIEYIINLFDLVEFRSDINEYSLKQIIPLTLDYLKMRALNSYTNTESGAIKERLMEMAGIGQNKEMSFENINSDVEPKLNYSLLGNFSFYEYDDSVRMINDLKWDRTKEFDKIKKVSELKEYHDKLVEHYNMLSNKEKNEKFMKFAERFRYLEDYNEGLKIKLLANPKSVLDAANEMKNCSGSYVTRISNGQYLLIMVYDKTKERKSDEDEKFMIGMNVTSIGLEFEQLKGPCNKQASNRQKELVIEYLKEKEISYREVRDLKMDTLNGRSRSENNLFGML
jgi:hypothetical protein